METDESNVRGMTTRELTDVFIRVGLLAALVVLCLRTFAPFANLLTWALILAVTLYPVHLWLAQRMGGKTGRAATAVVLIGLLLIGAPTVMLGSSFASQVHESFSALQNGEIHVPTPKAAVAEWPVIGERLYSAWSAAATDLPAFVSEREAQLQSLARSGVSAAAGTAGSVLQFLGSLIIAGIIMAFGESGSQAVERTLIRFTGPANGRNIKALSTATVRSVATGVIGIAFIQALLLGVGFLMAGIPAAGLLAMVVLLIGILQLPALIVTIPVIGYLWWAGDASTTSNVLFSVYLLVAGAADGFLKPMLLGRGVDAPMPVILLGALGGMMSGGIIGLFTGAVVLAVGYQIFMGWVDAGQVDSAGEQSPTHSAEQTASASE